MWRLQAGLVGRLGGASQLDELVPGMNLEWCVCVLDSAACDLEGQVRQGGQLIPFESDPDTGIFIYSLKYPPQLQVYTYIALSYPLQLQVFIYI